MAVFSLQGRIGLDVTDLKRNASDAKDRLDAIGDVFDRLDDGTEINVTADTGTAERELDQVAADAREVEGIDPTVNVDVVGGEVLDAMPDQIKKVADSLTGAAGPVAGMAALATGALALATQQSNIAIDAKTFADLTSSTVDTASRLGVVAGNAGVQFNDLSDIALQLNQGLRDNVGYADALGINLNDGKDPAERLVQVLDLMNSPLIDANDKAEIFSRLLGEEGVRQGQRMVTVLGDVEKAMEDVPDGAVVDDDDVAAALKYKRSIDELKMVLLEVGAAGGDTVIPMLTEITSSFADLRTELDSIRDEAKTLLPDDLFDDVTESGEGFSVVMSGLGFQQQNEHVKDLTLSTDDLTGSFVASEQEVTALTASTGEYNKTAELREHWDRKGEDAAEDVAVADEEAAAAADERAEAVADLGAEILDLIEAQGSLVGSDLKVEEAQIAAREASDEYKTLLEEQDTVSEELKLTTDEMRLAFIDAAQAQDSAAQSAAQATIDQREANGEVINGQEANRILAEEYRNLAETLDADSPLRKELEGWATDLDNIPGDVTTLIVADTDDAISRADAIIAKYLAIPNYKEIRVNTIQITSGGNGVRARGGPVNLGGSYLVGEEGPEMVTFGHDGYVHDAQTTAAALSSQPSDGFAQMAAASATPSYATSGMSSSPGGAGSVVTGDTHVTVMIDGQEFRGMIDTRIERSDDQKLLVS